MITADVARTIADRSRFGSGIVSGARVRAIRDMVASGRMTSRQQAKWAQILARPTPHVIVGPLNPWDISENYGLDQEGSQAALAVFRGDAVPAVDLALRWAVLRDAAAASSVAAILSAWSTITTWQTNSGSRFYWAEGWPLFIEAAFLISDSPAYTMGVRNAFKAATSTAIGLLATAYTGSNRVNETNNWAAWGLVAEMSTAALLQERARFDQAIFRWRQVLADTIRDNVPKLEVYRQGNSQGNGTYGLNYSNFHLNGLTLAAEWARANGEWLYDYVTPDGSSLRGVWENVRRWTRYPERFPFNSSGGLSYTNRIQAHVDILHALWPHPESADLIGMYDITEDYFGVRATDIIYRGQQLFA